MSQQAAKQAEFERDVEKLRVKFANQSIFSRQVTGKSLRFETNQILGGHLRGLKRLAKKYNTTLPEDAFIKDLETKVKEGKMSEAKIQQYRDRYAYVQDVWGKISDGKYNPALSAHDKGFRVDIVDMQPYSHNGQEGLKVDTLFWGSLKGQVSFGDIEIKLVRESEKMDENGEKQMLREFAETMGSGPPHVLVPDPTKWVAQWPSGVGTGYYILPKFPPPPGDVRFNMKMKFSVRTEGGGSIPIELDFPTGKAEAQWRKPAGVPWGAPSREMTEEEMKALGIGGKEGDKKDEDEDEDEKDK
jgi:hypothetical protein